jgi:pimeloyl-ACP methyl ester carboxylesterase
VIADGADSHLPQERIAEVTGRFPEGRFLTLPAGHRVHTTRPADFCAAVEEFLKE